MAFVRAYSHRAKVARKAKKVKEQVSKRDQRMYDQCLTGMRKRRLGCHASRKEVSRCRTRGESQGMCNVTQTPPLSLNKAEPTLALKPRGDITRSPKQGYQWPHKKD